jgi:N-formylglutamate amidohydrolase
MSIPSYCVFRRGRGPIVAAAVHQGHATRDAVAAALALDDCTRRREEDPYTGEWAQVAHTQIIGLRSRFEVDLNRPREQAVYRLPEHAWGLNVWREAPSAELVNASLREYDEFYSATEKLLRELIEEHGRVVVYDLHTYNHRRDGASAPPADAIENPEVNIGTGTMDSAYWAPVVDRFIADLRAFDYGGRRLDVRENVKFQGGGFGRWIHATFPRRVCAISVEFKKFFMDEWTGEADLDEVERIFRALQSTLPGVTAELERR